MSFYTFDIETIPGDEEIIRSLMPDDIGNPRMPRDLEHYVYVQHKGLSDPAKIEEHRRKHQADHQAKIADWNAKCIDAELKFFDRAALDATTGEIAIIGVMSPDKRVTVFVNAVGVFKTSAHNVHILSCESELVMLREWWAYVRQAWKTEDGFEPRFAGVYSSGPNGFDLPFLIQRSWINRVALPNVPIMAGRYAAPCWIDLADRWSLGRREKMPSVNTLAKALRCKSAKLEGKDGSTFRDLWQRDKNEAIAYNVQDLVTEREIAEAMGL